MRPIRQSVRHSLAAAAMLLGATVLLDASGPVGVYGIVEKVVFEPNEAAPERVQVWGAFAYADGGTQGTGLFSAARRGYLYFRLPADDAGLVTTVRREWLDLKAVAGTGQAVAFGNYGYIGAFQALDPGAKSTSPPYILELYPGRGVQTDMRVRPATEPPAAPAVYQTNVGLVKIPADGTRADVVRRLREALAAR